MKKYAIILIFLSPLIAELFSGSTPFSTFFTPYVFLVYLGVYGAGALLIREVAVHKKLNYASVVLFGAAFGVLEEGILLKSWFDPNWMGAAITSQAWRVYGISVLQPFANVCYHAVVSIAAPIVLLEAVSGRTPWLSKRQIAGCSILFCGAAVLLSQFNQYPVRLWQYGMALFIFVVFCILGWKAPTLHLPLLPAAKVRTPFQLWWLSAGFVVLLFVIFYTLTKAHLPGIIILGLALVMYYTYAIVYGSTYFGNAHYFAAAAGIVTGLLPIVGIMARTAPEKTPNFVGTLCFVGILVVGYKVLKF